MNVKRSDFLPQNAQNTSPLFIWFFFRNCALVLLSRKNVWELSSSENDAIWRRFEKFTIPMNTIKICLKFAWVVGHFVFCERLFLWKWNANFRQPSKASNFSGLLHRLNASFKPLVVRMNSIQKVLFGQRAIVRAVRSASTIAKTEPDTSTYPNNWTFYVSFFG